MMTDPRSQSDRPARDPSESPQSKAPVVDIDPLTLFAIVAALLVVPVFLAGFFFQ